MRISKFSYKLDNFIYLWSVSFVFGVFRGFHRNILTPCPPQAHILFRRVTSYIEVDALNRVIGLNTHLDEAHIDMDRPFMYL